MAAPVLAAAPNSESMYTYRTIHTHTCDKPKLEPAVAAPILAAAALRGDKIDEGRDRGAAQYIFVCVYVYVHVGVYDK